MNNKPETALEHMVRPVKEHISRFNVITFCGTFVSALLVHMYMFTHKFINHDDILGLFSDCSFGLSSGRWLLCILTKLTGTFSSSWLNGLFGALFLAAAVVLLVELFSVRHYLSAGIIAVSVVAFPCVASTYSYMFCSYQYLFAMATALLGAWMIRKERLGWMFLGSCMIALGMGCYQAYFCLAAVVLLVCVILDLCEDRWNGDAKACLMVGLKYIAFLALGMILYYAVLKIALGVTGETLSEYKGINEMGHLTPAILLTRLHAAWVSFWDFYKAPIFHVALYWLFLLSIILDFAALTYCVVRRKLYRHPLSLLMLAALISILPLGCNLVYIMTEADCVHLVMRDAMLIPLLLPILALDKLELPEAGASVLARRGVAMLSVLLLLVSAAFGYEYVLITNRAYFCLDITYENAYAYYTKLSAKIELQDGYVRGEPVAFCGTASMDSIVPQTYMTGVLTGNDALNIYSRQQMFHYMLGSSYPSPTKEEKDSIKASEEFRDMPCYPSAGSIARIDGIITVKLSK